MLTLSGGRIILFIATTFRGIAAFVPIFTTPVPLEGNIFPCI